MSSTTPNMSIAPALSCDMPRLMAIMFSAFHGEPYHEHVDNVDVPPTPNRNATPDSIDFFWPAPSAYANPVQAAAGSRYLESWHSNPTEEHFLKATDPTSGEIVGWARWIIHSAARPKELWDEDLPPYPEYAETLSQAQREAIVAFTYVSERQRREMFEGRPFVDLAMVAVDSDWQGRGVGRGLVEWGKERARVVKAKLMEMGLREEAEGLLVHVESTTKGMRLYRGCGFEEVGRVLIKKEWFEGEEDEVYPVLRWQPG